MKALKKTLSLVLAICMLASVACIAVSANQGDSQHRKLVTDVVNSVDKVDTHTYRFYVPQAWRNQYNDYYDLTPDHFAAGIYWWEGPYNCKDYKGELDNDWPGYAVTQTDPGDPNIFVADVPVTAGKIIWNNLVDGGMDDTQPIFTAAIQSMDIQHEYYDDGEDGYGFYPKWFYQKDDQGNVVYDEFGEPVPRNFDGMIFVCNPKATEENPLTHKFTYKGVWFFYYGNGEYGIYETREEAAAANAILKDGQFPDYGFEIDTTSMKLKVGQSDKITPNDNTAVATVADPKIASIKTGADGSVTVKGLKAGTTTVTFTLDKNGEVEKATCKVTVTKAANPMKVTAKNKTYKVKQLKKKAQSYKAITVSKNQGKVTYKVTKKNKRLTFKNGKVTVKRKTKKGKYKITVQIKAAGNASYNPATVKKNITVTVKK
jgi:hypothetical protein